MVENRDSSAGAGFDGVTRKILERVPLPGENRELFVVEVTYPPGSVAPLHRHPVGGAIYIVEGIAESAYGSDEPQRYRTGETLQDRSDQPHTHFRNCDPDRPLRFLTVYVLEPGHSYTIGSDPRAMFTGRSEGPVSACRFENPSAATRSDPGRLTCRSLPCAR
jgi:quercetin dioxygenase-like cupin family protein